MKGGLSAVAGVIWYLLKPSGKERIVIGSDKSVNTDDSTNVSIINIGPFIQANTYVGSSTITYNVTYLVEGQKPVKYGMHLIDAMVQWKQNYDDELNQGKLMEVWDKVIIPPVQEKIKSARAVICLGVADEVGSNRQSQEDLASRRAANLEKVPTTIRNSEDRIYSLVLGQWLKNECSQKHIGWDNQRRLAFITVDDNPDELDYRTYVRDAADRLRSGLKSRATLKDQPELEKMLKDNETLMDMYLNCYSKSQDWVII